MEIKISAAEILSKLHEVRRKDQESAVLETIQYMDAETCLQSRCKGLERVPIEKSVRSALENAGFDLKTTFLGRVYIIAPYDWK